MNAPRPGIQFLSSWKDDSENKKDEFLVSFKEEEFT